MYYALTLSVHFVEQQFILLVLRNDIVALHDNDTVVNPLPVITAKFRQPVHAEPQKSRVGILEALLAFELGENTVTACDSLEALELIDCQKAHIGRACKPCAVDCTRAEAGFNFAEVDACEVSPAEKLFRQRLELTFAAVAFAD